VELEKEKSLTKQRQFQDFTAVNGKRQIRTVKDRNQIAI